MIVFQNILSTSVNIEREEKITQLLDKHSVKEVTQQMLLVRVRGEHMAGWARFLKNDSTQLVRVN